MAKDVRRDFFLGGMGGKVSLCGPRWPWTHIYLLSSDSTKSDMEDLSYITCFLIQLTLLCDGGSAENNSPGSQW